MLLASTENRSRELVSVERSRASALDVERDERVRRREEEDVRVENGTTRVERSSESNCHRVIREREVGRMLGNVKRVREV